MEVGVGLVERIGTRAALGDAAIGIVDDLTGRALQEHRVDLATEGVTGEVEENLERARTDVHRTTGEAQALRRAAATRGDRRRLVNGAAQRMDARDVERWVHRVGRIDRVERVRRSDKTELVGRHCAQVRQHRRLAGRQLRDDPLELGPQAEGGVGDRVRHHAHRPGTGRRLRDQCLTGELIARHQRAGDLTLGVEHFDREGVLPVRVVDGDPQARRARRHRQRIRRARRRAARRTVGH